MKLHPPGTILLPKSGASTFTDHRVIITRAGYVSSHLATIKADEKDATARYLFYVLQTISARDVAEDASYPTLSLEQVKSIVIPAPPLAEQHRIVAILDESFEAIATAILNAEKNLAKARELFDQHLRCLFDSLNDVEHLTLAQAATTFSRGKSKHRPRNDPALYGGDFPFVQTGDVRNAEQYIESFSQSDNQRGLAQSKLWPIGTVCITIAANIAETAILGLDACFPDSIIGMIPDERRTTSQFVEYMLRYYKKVLQSRGKGSAQDNINMATFEMQSLPFPSLERQASIVASLDGVADGSRELIELYTRKFAALVELKQSLLVQAFSGELTTQAPSAAVLAPANDNAFATPEHVANIIAFAHQRHEAAGRQNTFGRVKAQKNLHLVESVGGVELGRQPWKDAAGPNDFPHMLRAEAWAKERGFFEFRQRSDGGYDFKKLTNYAAMMTAAKLALAPIKTEVARVTDLLTPLDSGGAEVLATVHAAWNNLILDGAAPTDDAIVREARDDWHASKLKIAEVKFRDAIKLIRKKGIVPDGSGKRVAGQLKLL